MLGALFQSRVSDCESSTGVPGYQATGPQYSVTTLVLVTCMLQQSFNPGKPDSIITAVLSKTPSTGLPENELAR